MGLLSLKAKADGEYRFWAENRLVEFCQFALMSLGIGTEAGEWRHKRQWFFTVKRKRYSERVHKPFYHSPVSHGVGNSTWRSSQIKRVWIAAQITEVLHTTNAWLKYLLLTSVLSEMSYSTVAPVRVPFPRHDPKVAIWRCHLLSRAVCRHTQCICKPVELRHEGRATHELVSKATFAASNSTRR